MNQIFITASIISASCLIFLLAGSSNKRLKTKVVAQTVLLAAQTGLLIWLVISASRI